MSESIDCSPDTSIIESYRNNPNLSSWKAIAEVVDNSFDAGANRVSIDWDKESRCLTITDDGAGCKDPEVMAKLGGSFRQAKAGVVLGRYGIGLKEASVWMCDRMVITSSFDGGGWKVVVDWKKIQDTKRWEVPVERNGVYAGRGVCIEMEHIRSSARVVANDTIQTLSETFRPAILSGRQIVIQGKPLAAPDLPLLKDQVDQDGTFDGKSYNIKYGIKADKSNAYGWTIAYGHRILAANYTKSGFGDHSPSRFYGYITLYDTGESKWSLNRFKDGFDGIDALLDTLADQIAPLLERAETEGLNLEIQTAIGQVENELNRSVFGNRIKEKRPGKAGEEGTVEPRNTGRRRVEAKHADPNQPGSVAVKAGKFTKFKVVMDWEREGEIGSCTDHGSTLMIHINRNHPYLLNSEITEERIRNTAIALLAAYDSIVGDGQLLLRIDAESESQDAFKTFRGTYSNVLTSVASTDQEEKKA